MATKNSTATLEIDALKQGRIKLRLIGLTPLYLHAMSAKARRDLLIGGGKKTAAEKRLTIKHDPQAEFRDSTYRLPSGPTLLGFPAPGIKTAMATAALETPGVTKSSVQRLIFLPQQMVNIWGTPYLKCDVVRNSDASRTPDIRTRAFLPRWCTEVDIAFVAPALSVYSVVSLLQNAGIVAGIGDFRQEKGRGSFGTFAVSGSEDMGEWADTWAEITTDGREAQAAALENPMAADGATQELLDILAAERIKRAA